MTHALAKPERLPSDPPPTSHTSPLEAPPVYELRVQKDSLSFTGTELTFLGTLEAYPEQVVLVHIMFNDRGVTRLDVAKTNDQVDVLFKLVPADSRQTVIYDVLNGPTVVL